MKFETSFHSISDLQLNHLFRDETWSRLSIYQKQQLCQEKENRLAANRGVDPRRVVLKDFEGATYGQQQGSVIYLNSSLVENGSLMIYDDEGNSLHYPIDAVGWNLYETICHEDEHCAQYDRGVFQSSASYIEFSTDRLLYRIQPDERDAFHVGHSETIRAIEQLRENGFHDPEMNKYIQQAQLNSYTNALRQAQERFNDINIAQTLELYVQYTENGLTPENPTPSYVAIQNIVHNQHMIEMDDDEGATASARHILGGHGQTGIIDPDVHEENHEQSYHYEIGNSLFPDGSEIIHSPNESEFFEEDGSSKMDSSQNLEDFEIDGSSLSAEERHEEEVTQEQDSFGYGL